MDINSPEINKIIEKIAEENNLKPEVVRRVAMSQFECVKHHMKRASAKIPFFPYIRLPHLFSFVVVPKKQKFYIEREKRNLEEDVQPGERKADD